MGTIPTTLLDYYFTLANVFLLHGMMMMMSWRVKDSEQT